MNTETTTGSHSVQQSKDILVADLRRVVSDADALMKDVVDSTSGEFASARRRLETKLGEARARIDAARIATTRRVCATANAAHAFAKENPWTMAGVAAALGFVASYLLINRSGRSGRY